MGSVTKLYTAVTVLQLHETGFIDIDRPVHSYIDPFLTRTNGTTLMAIYNNASINTITARQLMGMRSGVADYNNFAVQVRQKLTFSLNLFGRAEGVTVKENSCRAS